MPLNPERCPLCGSEDLVNERTTTTQKGEQTKDYRMKCRTCDKILRPDRWCKKCKQYFEEPVVDGFCPSCAEKVKNQHNALVGYKHRLRGDKTLTEEQITDMVEEKRKEQDGGV